MDISYVTFSQGLWQRIQVTSNKSFRHVFAFHSLLPKGQTHREVGAQSHGSADQQVDRQTAEVIFTLAVFFRFAGKGGAFRKTLVSIV